MSRLRNQLNSGSPIALSGDAETIVQHALEAFGSEEKAWHWLERANPLFGNSPIEILRTDRSRYELVDDELTKIEHGVFS
jgi:uncharacterized protein (DUF2384 family)